MSVAGSEPAGAPDRAGGPGSRPSPPEPRATGESPSPHVAGPATRRALRAAFAATLALEAVTVLFVPRAIAQTGPGLTAARLAVLLSLAVQRTRVGLGAGTALQLALIGTGTLTAAMYALGGIFAIVWGYLLRLRRRLLAGG